MDAVGAASDAVLVAAVRNGDTDAFETIYLRHAPAVRHTIAAVVHDRDHVDDGVQDVFVKALTRLDSLVEPDKIAAWLKAIARNVAIDGVRGRSTSDLDAFDTDVFESQNATPSELAEIRELSGLVRSALTELAPRDLEAVRLAAISERASEIAEQLGVSEASGKVILHRARRRLRLALKLEMLVRRRAGACVEFQELASGGDIAQAAKHLRGCGECQRAGSTEIRRYGTKLGPSTSPK